MTAAILTSRHETPRRDDRKRLVEDMDAGCRAGLSGSCAAMLSDYGRLGGVSDLYTTVSDYRGSDCG